MVHEETLLILGLLLLVGNMWFLIRFLRFQSVVEQRLREIAAKAPQPR